MQKWVAVRKCELRLEEMYLQESNRDRGRKAHYEYSERAEALISQELASEMNYR